MGELPENIIPWTWPAAGQIVETAKRFQKRFVFVINAAEPRARITAEARIALSQHGTMAPVTVYDREDFTDSMENGRTDMETNPNGVSATEIRQLWNYLAERLRIGLPAG